MCSYAKQLTLCIRSLRRATRDTSGTLMYSEQPRPAFSFKDSSTGSPVLTCRHKVDVALTCYAKTVNSVRGYEEWGYCGPEAEREFSAISSCSLSASCCWGTSVTSSISYSTAPFNASHPMCLQRIKRQDEMQ
ncbi:hypothetical protein EYF80_025553 [Liparis tanakae]|uniref:Uncharacterized protein n=1 Tax=Liparis tanakae TaxID=230148 RepID=A0A4Z2HG32_9TELE|nr:hypothetical protein EYF80_025553 [Liparis tanakae]